MALKRGAETFDQTRSSEWLCQEASCPRLQRSRAAHFVRESRYENEWHPIIPGAQHRLQFQAAHTWHLHIRNHARRVIQVVRLQEVLSRRERLDRVPVRPQKFTSRRTNRRIIVDDGNN